MLFSNTTVRQACSEIAAEYEDIAAAEAPAHLAAVDAAIRRDKNLRRWHTLSDRARVAELDARNGWGSWSLARRLKQKLRCAERQMLRADTVRLLLRRAPAMRCGRPLGARTRRTRVVRAAAVKSGAGDPDPEPESRPRAPRSSTGGVA